MTRTTNQLVNIMDNDHLKITLSELLPAASYEEGGQWLNVYVDHRDWLYFANSIRNHPKLNFDYLFCLTCVDWKTHLTMVYHLESAKYRHTIVAKSKVDRAQPFASQAEGGNVFVLQRDWTEAYLDELVSFPDGEFSDQVDASSGAFNMLAPLSAGTPGIGLPEPAQARNYTLPPDTFR